MAFTWDMYNRLKRYIDSLIGTPADTDVSTDIAAIKTVVDGLVIRPTYTVAYATTTETTYQNALSVTGSGVLYFLWGNVANGVTDTIQVKLTIDGTAWTETTADAHTNPRALMPTTRTQLAFHGSDNTPFYLGIQFSTSLLVQFKSGGGGNTNCGVQYGLDS